MDLLPIPVIAFVIAVATTPVLVVLARRIDVVAQPARDRWHESPTPLLGGVALYAGVAAPLLVMLEPSPARTAILIGGGAMFLLGLVDDVVRLSPATKLVGQVVAATFAVLVGVEASFARELGPTFIDLRVLTIPLTVLWIVGITNAVNLLDNMDGLAAGIVAVSAGSLTACSLYWGDTALAALCLLFAGSAIGFLVWNFEPAKVFMGDAGALFLGYGLGVIAVAGTYQHAGNLFIVLAVPLLSLGIPVLDTTFVTLMRKLHRRRISRGGQDHLSHRLVALGMSPRRAVLFLYAVCALLGAAAVAALYGDLFANVVYAGIALLGVVVLGVVLGEVKIYRRVEVEAKGEAGERPEILRSTILNYLRPLALIGADLVLTCVAYLGAYLIVYEGRVPPFETERLLESLPVVIIGKLLFLRLFGVYRGFWRYFSTRDVMRLLSACGGGSVAVILTLVFVTRFEGYSRAVLVLDALLFFLLTGGLRLVYKGLQRGFGWRPRSAPAALILGADDEGERCLRALLERRQEDRRVVGFLDDDARKRGRTIHGVPVLGTREDLERIAERRHVEEVFVADLAAADEAFRARCRRSGIAVRVHGTVGGRPWNEEPEQGGVVGQGPLQPID